MELLAVSLVLLFAFQLFQAPRRQQDQRVRESLDLITAPTEPPATPNRLKLLLDGDEPETLETFSPVNVYSTAVEATAPVEDVPTTAAIAATVTPATVAAEPLESVAVPAERVLAEDRAIIAAVASAAVSGTAEVSEVVEAVPFAEERRAASLSRKDAVFALLDEAAVQGISGYTALTEYVKQQSGQGTSRSTIKAWKEAREAAKVVAHG